MSFPSPARPKPRRQLQRHPVIARESVRFIAERDSLNAAVLGPDAAPGTPEFDLFVKEVVREMTVKAGQKCTAIRRALVPAAQIDAAEAALKRALAEIAVGDPRDEKASDGRAGQPRATRRRAGENRELSRGSADRVRRSRRTRTPTAKARSCRRCFCAATSPAKPQRVHEIEPFGPVATLMPYREPRRRHHAGESRQGLAGDVAVHARSRRCARRDDRVGRVSRPPVSFSTAIARKNRPDTDRPCPRSSMAARAARAAARRWAVCAA